MNYVEMKTIHPYLLTQVTTALAQVCEDEGYSWNEDLKDQLSFSLVGDYHTPEVHVTLPNGDCYHFEAVITYELKQY